MKSLALSLALFFCGTVMAKPAIDVIAMEYPPFTTKDRDDFGISFFHLEQYAKENFKSDYKPLFLPPARAQQILSSGQWCASFFPPESTDDNAVWVTLSEQNIKLGLYRRAEATPFLFDSIDDLQGKAAFLRSRSKSGIHKIVKDSNLEIYSVENVEQGIRMLLAGRVDYAFGDNTTLNTFEDKYDRNKLQFSETVLLEGPVGFYYNTRCAENLFKSAP